MTAAGVTDTRTRDQRLWDEEVATIVAVAPTLYEAARIALCSALESIAAESTDPSTTSDVRRMLTAITGSVRLHYAA